MVTSQHTSRNSLTEKSQKILDTRLPSAPSTTQLVENTPELDPTGANIFQQIEQLNERNTASKQKVEALEQQLKVTNDKIAVSATYGFRDASGNFHRIKPNALNAVVDYITARDDGRYQAYVVSLDPSGAVKKGIESKVSANNRAVAQLLGVETKNLDDNDIKRKLGKIATSKSFSAIQPSGGSLRAVYLRADGTSGDFFIPLTIMNSPSFSGKIAGGTAGNGVGLQAEAGVSLSLEQDRTSSKTLQLGAQGSVSNGNTGVFTSAGIQKFKVNPEMLTAQTTNLRAGGGLTTTGPAASVSYSNTQTDLVTRKTENTFSGRLGFNPYAGPFMKVDTDLGTVDMSAGINVLPFLGTPFPGAVSLFFTDEGEKSYWMKTKDNTRVVSMQGTNNESRGSIGIAGILPIVIPVAIPGPGIMPTRQIELPESTTQALRVGDISDSIIAMNQRATDGKFYQPYSLAAAAYRETFSTEIKLPQASMAVNVLPQSELTSGRYNTIVANAEKELRIKIVDKGQVVASREEIQGAVRNYLRKNNPGLTNTEYLDQLRKKNPVLEKQTNKEIGDAIIKYAMVAVEKERVPTANELLKMGMKTSTMIPHVDAFTLKAQPRVEIITGEDGKKYIVAQVAINVALINNPKAQEMRINDSQSRSQNDKWLVSEQVALLDPNRNVREQIDAAASQVELTTGMYLQKAFEALDAANNRRMNLDVARQDVLKAFEGIGFTPIQDKGEINVRWKQKVSAITTPDKKTQG
jgi:hypothetical protein